MKILTLVFVFFAVFGFTVCAFAGEGDYMTAPDLDIQYFTPIATGTVAPPMMNEYFGIDQPEIKIDRVPPPEVATSTVDGKALDCERIDISIAEQKLRVSNIYCQILYEFPVSTGRVAGTTPKGVTKVYNHALNPVSRAYGCHLYRWLAVTSNGKIGIHGLFMSGYEAKLGRPASHGCIRLSRPNAETVYNWVVGHLKTQGEYPQVYIH